jgi:hypothetical protein
VESYCFFPEKLNARAELLKDALSDLDNYDFNAPRITAYKGDAAKAVALSSLAQWQKLGQIEYKARIENNKLIFDFRHLAENIRLDLEPGRLCRVIDLRINTPETHGHDADFLPGVRFLHDNGVVTVTIERSKFDGFRVSDRMPWRFNVVTESAALNPEHPWPARLCQGSCSVDAGIIFMDVLTHLERTADQCSDIAMLTLGKHNAEILNNHHQYLQDLHSSTDQSYLAELKNRKEQYLDPLNNISF